MCCYTGMGGWNGYWNKSQYTKLSLENKFLLPLLPGIEPATFRSWVQHCITETVSQSHDFRRERRAYTNENQCVCILVECITSKPNRLTEWLPLWLPLDRRALIMFSWLVVMNRKSGLMELLLTHTCARTLKCIKKNLKQSWLPAFGKRKKKKDTKGWTECFWIRQNKTKCTNFQGNPLLQSHKQYRFRKQRSKQIT